jgi:hypothetical protein
MTPTDDVRLLIGTLLAAAVPLDQATALNRVGLVMAPFVPSGNLAYADLTFATFTGATPKTVALGAQQVGIDPVTGDQIITIVEPAGGWRFQATASTNLPQTIYGFALFDSTGPGPLIATELLPNPITIAASGQELNLGTVKLVVVQQPLS